MQFHRFDGNTYSVSISGPGGCVNNVLVVVKDALEKAGFAVIRVTNDCPATSPDEQHLEFVRGLTKPGTVAISVDHTPWGG